MKYRAVVAMLGACIVPLCCVAAEVAPAASSGADTLSVIYARKSVRHYTGVAATKDQLETLLKAGMAAPTAVDRRPWAFVVVTDKKILNALADGLPYSKMIVQAGAAIIVCGDLNKALPGEGQAFWVQDCSAATQNILLAAQALGLGAVWTGMYPSSERVNFVQQALGIPKEVIPLNIIAVGHPVGDEKPKDKFDPVNIHWEKW